MFLGGSDNEIPRAGGFADVMVPRSQDMEFIRYPDSSSKIIKNYESLLQHLTQSDAPKFMVFLKKLGQTPRLSYVAWLVDEVVGAKKTLMVQVREDTAAVFVKDQETVELLLTYHNRIMIDHGGAWVARSNDAALDLQEIIRQRRVKPNPDLPIGLVAIERKSQNLQNKSQPTDPDNARRYYLLFNPAKNPAASDPQALYFNPEATYRRKGRSFAAMLRKHRIEQSTLWDHYPTGKIVLDVDAFADCLQESVIAPSISLLFETERDVSSNKKLRRIGDLLANATVWPQELMITCPLRERVTAEGAIALAESLQRAFKRQKTHLPNHFRFTLDLYDQLVGQGRDGVIALLDLIKQLPPYSKINLGRNDLGGLGMQAQAGRTTSQLLALAIKDFPEGTFLNISTNFINPPDIFWALTECPPHFTLFMEATNLWPGTAQSLIDVLSSGKCKHPFTLVLTASNFTLEDIARIATTLKETIDKLPKGTRIAGLGDEIWQLCKQEAPFSMKEEWVLDDDWVQVADSASVVASPTEDMNQAIGRLINDLRKRQPFKDLLWLAPPSKDGRLSSFRGNPPRASITVKSSACSDEQNARFNPLTCLDYEVEQQSRGIVVRPWEDVDVFTDCEQLFTLLSLPQDQSLTPPQPQVKTTHVPLPYRRESSLPTMPLALRKALLNSHWDALIRNELDLALLFDLTTPEEFWQITQDKPEWNPWITSLLNTHRNTHFIPMNEGTYSVRDIHVLKNAAYKSFFFMGLSPQFIDADVLAFLNGNIRSLSQLIRTAPILPTLLFQKIFDTWLQRSLEEWRLLFDATEVLGFPHSTVEWRTFYDKKERINQQLSWLMSSSSALTVKQKERLLEIIRQLIAANQAQQRANHFSIIPIHDQEPITDTLPVAAPPTTMNYEAMNRAIATLFDGLRGEPPFIGPMWLAPPPRDTVVWHGALPPRNNAFNVNRVKYLTVESSVCSDAQRQRFNPLTSNDKDLEDQALRIALTRKTDVDVFTDCEQVFTLLSLPQDRSLSSPPTETSSSFLPTMPLELRKALLNRNWNVLIRNEQDLALLFDLTTPEEFWQIIRDKPEWNEWIISLLNTHRNMHFEHVNNRTYSDRDVHVLKNASYKSFFFMGLYAPQFIDADVLAFLNEKIQNLSQLIPVASYLPIVLFQRFFDTWLQRPLAEWRVWLDPTPLPGTPTAIDFLKQKKEANNQLLWLLSSALLTAEQKKQVLSTIKQLKAEDLAQKRVSYWMFDYMDMKNLMRVPRLTLEHLWQIIDLFDLELEHVLKNSPRNKDFDWYPNLLNVCSFETEVKRALCLFTQVQSNDVTTSVSDRLEKRRQLELRLKGLSPCEQHQQRMADQEVCFSQAQNEAQEFRWLSIWYRLTYRMEPEKIAQHPTKAQLLEFRDRMYQDLQVDELREPPTVDDVQLLTPPARKC